MHSVMHDYNTDMIIQSFHLLHSEQSNARRVSWDNSVTKNHDFLPRRDQLVACGDRVICVYWLMPSLFGSLFPTLWCKQRLDDAFRSKSPIWITAYSQSPHEYLICVAAITHFRSPLCPLVNVAGTCVCVCINECVCVSVQAGAAGVSYRERAHAEVFRSVSLSNCSSGVQGGETWWDRNL